MHRELKYVEHCAGYTGLACIGYVETSKSGRMVYFNGRGLARAARGGISGNHYDAITGDEYWVSGVKKRGTNRHWAGSGRILIESAAVNEYLALTGRSKLDPTVFEVVDGFELTDRERIHELLNAKHE